MPPTEFEIRAELVRALEADLVGPFVPDTQALGGQEVLGLPPSRWYLTGFLAPQGGRAPDVEDPDSQGELALGDEVQAEDAGVTEPEPKREVRFPASMGVSVFLPPGEGDFIEVSVRYADYDKVEIADDDERRTKVGWKRVPHAPEPVRVPLDRAALEHVDGIAVPGSRGLVLRGELRTTNLDGLAPDTRLLSLFLVNTRGALEQDRDHAFVFQVSLALSYAGGFVSRPNRRGEGTDDDDSEVLALLFRDHAEWAVGHNTSVKRPEKDAKGRVTRLETTQLPSHEVLDVEHVTFDDVTTAMHVLEKLDGDGLERALSPLVDAYAVWIGHKRREPLRAELEPTRDGLMNKADTARKRIAEGIALLGSNAEVREAFTLMNRAMHVAAEQADKLREDPRYSGARRPEWRPFQLAFVLMNLPSIADPSHADRGVADLIYFPTGGGKTEAYLGLIAFTLLLRRLRGKSRPDEGRGVAIILRYTLRLLTLDQLGRAATLICALEAIRTRDPKRLGNTRFTVGLWVGKSATANRLDDVHRALHDHTPGRTESPFPLTRCPWCGEDIKIQNIKLVDESGKPSKSKYKRAVVYCDGMACAFRESATEGRGLPVLFVDEQIYQELPDFLVATVDKFAMMPWLTEVGMLFGRATHLDARRAYGAKEDAPKGATALPSGLLPPELIVQDEMHLISGPLGTMVGLYEAAVDYLCAREVDGVRRAPKIICSTATVRRARQQVRALYDRELAIFPPRGIDDGDNFFARPNTKKAGRLYVGVGASGRALRAVSVRTYATMLAAAAKHFDPKGAAKQPADPYMTLIGYFNSLRELGGMRRLVEDEVSNRVATFANDKRPHYFVGQHPWAANRKVRLPAELTSRVSTEVVKDTKMRLGARATEVKPESLDVVLASNMISVGLDVDRLGLMVVTGQPKTSSEYIQATSRVGRAYPGLVVTCLNLTRPRDRSHFERFVPYHESFYREVEATSVTPFSGQTLDRGLVGTFLSMIRHGIPDMAPPLGFMKAHAHRADMEALLEWLVGRARTHRGWHDTEAETRIADAVRQYGRHFLDAWERIEARGREGGARVYSELDRAKHLGKRVMFSANDDRPADMDEQLFEAPMSMRDVEPNAHVWVRFRQLDEK